MKIAIAVPSWPPGFQPNGIVTYSSYLVPALRQLGHEVFVLTGRKMRDDGDPYTVEMQHFTRTPSLLDRAVRRFAPDIMTFNVVLSRIADALREPLGKYRIDVFEIEEAFGWSLAATHLDLVPVIVRLHGPWFLTGRFDSARHQKKQNIRRQKREGEGMRRANFITAPSSAVLEAVKDRYKLRSSASRVIRNPIKAAELSETWNANACVPGSLLFVGRFDALKGGDLVLRGFAELAASRPNTRLTFIGRDGGIKDPDGRTIFFQNFVRENIPEQYRSRIDFHGQIQHSDIESFRRTHFATIIASQFENASYSILEAMSLGCPIIATAVGGTPELIEHGRNGLLVSSQNVAEMAAACRKLLDNPTLAARLGRQAWNDSRNFYNPEIIAQQTAAIYQEAIDAFASRHWGNFRR